MKFETILKYVNLPKPAANGAGTSLSTPPSKSKVGSHEHEQPQLVRKSLNIFKIVFDWLRSNGVRTILEVRVQDDEDISHSDEVIENALVGFGVELWDWKRFDICSETIFHAAPGAREVFLYSSGNNAVLRSWSCKHGLVKLKNVRFSSGPTLS
jgi:hypothetical protein